MDTTPRPRPAVLKYLRQRIKELEHELEDKRVRLFESEEARSELEARVEGQGIVLTPESSATDSAAQDEDSSDGEEELVAEEGTEGNNEGDNRHANLGMIEHYQSVINLLVAGHNEKIKELEDNHRTEIELLKSSNDEAIKQQQEDHEVEHRAQAQELENLGQLYNDRVNICAAIIADKTESHNAELAHLRIESATIAHSIEQFAANVRNAAMAILEASSHEMSTYTHKLKALFGEEGEVAKVAVTVTSPGGSTDSVDNGEGSSSLSLMDFVRIMAEKQKKRLD